MTRPYLNLAVMVVFLLFIIAAVVQLGPGITRAFQANVPLNSLIVVLLLAGIGISLFQVVQIDHSVRVLNRVRRGGRFDGRLPALLLPVASHMQSAERPAPLTAATLRAMLDGVFARLDERRDTSRYLMNVLILLGLLGTFWGLLETVSGISSVISGLQLGQGDISAVFEQFKGGLERPLGGMGISFSASLFGLASSLVLGFLDLLSGRAQNHFGLELEEWLSKGVNSQSGSAIDTTPLPLPPAAGAAYSAALIEGLAEHLTTLQRALAARDAASLSDRTAARELRESITTLGEQLHAHNAVLRRIDGSLNEVASGITQGRDRLTEDIRQEVRTVARILSTLVEPR